MKYEDEGLAGLKKELRRLCHRDIKEGVYVEERFITFAPRRLWQDRDIEMYIPEDFIEMPEAVRELKYPSVNRPQVILTSLDTKINFAFNGVEESIGAEQMETFLIQMREVIRRTNPAVVFYKEKKGKLPHGQEIHMFDFKSYGIDEALYNMITFVSLKNITLQGIFNCPERSEEDWSEAAWQAFQTIGSRMPAGVRG